MFNFLKKKQHPTVTFETEHWFVRKYAPVRPASEFIPAFWKEMPTFLDRQEHFIDSEKTVKSCPAVVDMMTAGYVIPAWCDIELEPDAYNNIVMARYSSTYFNHALHSDQQLGPVLEQKFPIRSVIRLDNPWKMWCAEGYSLMYLPLTYWDNRGWEALPGIIDQDKGGVVTPINIMMSSKEKVIIKQGEPIVQIIPFKRENITAVTRNISKTGVERINAINGMHTMQFKGWRSFVTGKKSYKIDNQDTELPGN
jgi:hypothetical protein|tara:strand:+ start:1179 stop:1937 length:759 start_codon:yes stop_codon:yes gene_type:complete